MPLPFPLSPHNRQNPDPLEPFVVADVLVGLLANAPQLFPLAQEEVAQL
jgi:hypothetical protein